MVAERPVLESGSASTGQVMDSKLISEIPLGDGTAYGLTRLVAGATFERSYALQRPMDNDNLRGLTVSGAINSEFSIDGSSNVGSQARVAIQPPADAIQEFKVDTAVYDAQVGHTGAGAVNLALKSGTNDFHGAASFYNRDDSRSANLFASNARGDGKTPRNYNRFSATLTGPIVRNKTFFMLSYEKLQDDTVETVTGFVPTEKMRRGDFSELLPLGIQIYDPRTARLVNGQVTRDPFPGNIIPAGRINPVSRNVLDYYPLPNQAGAADLTGNFFAEQPWTYGYDFQMVRLDQNWTDDQRTYVRFIRNFRREERYNWAGEQQGIDISRGGTDRFSYNLALGHTWVMSRSLFFDVKGSFLRFNDDQAPAESADTLRPRVARLLRPDGSALPRLQPRPDVQPGRERGLPGLPQHGQPRLLPGRQPERVQLRARAAVLQPPGGADLHQGLGRAQRQGRLRLAEPAPERGQRGLPRGPVPLRQHVHAAVRQLHRPLRPGRGRLHAGPAHQQLVHRDALDAVVRDHQPRLLHPRRLARGIEADPERRPPLRPRAGDDGEPEPQHPRLRPHDARVPSRPRRRPTSPLVRPPASPSPPASSRSSAAISS